MLKERLDLQLFASDELEEVEEPNNEELDTTNEGQEEKDLLDMIEEDENLKKQFQSEVDRMITRAIQTRDKKHQEELKKEKQRANMTAEELQAEKERELQERENKLKQYELELQKIDYCKENNIPLDLAPYIRVESEDEIENQAQDLVQVIDKLVQGKVKEKLKEDGYNVPKDDQQGPKIGLEALEGDLSIEEINKSWDNLFKA